MFCQHCKADNIAAHLRCIQCGSELSGHESAELDLQKKPLVSKFYGQIASWVVIGLFVLLYKVVLPPIIDTTLWENSTVFGVGVALSWIAGRLIGKLMTKRKTATH
ncbi:hypothetical protein [Glaciimonas immobilis]|uniref:Zinc ribbon domain-containing protein n=1 Tax=Glaciimonas immobilis TaxID=728004 RepID=A0A840RNK6_9BURK|nr:hypothetical protein [Glaciimonas immobilis]KAF3998030.1 hypothetical protein HAV38_10760 [Glaciimonas immobilis]MBB5199285.1 hypothetical protein [Glaciimonas immobilis]